MVILIIIIHTDNTWFLADYQNNPIDIFRE